MPIKRGRKAETLAAAAAPTPASEEDENAAWEARIAAEAGGGDPLDVWIKYIRWWQDRCVAGGPVQQLLPVLERCAFAFKEDPRYTDDARYLRVWISYADLVRDAEPIFDYLYGRRIGETHTLFWESWAAVLEAKRKLNAADKVFSRGIQMRSVGQLLPSICWRHGVLHSTPRRPMPCASRTRKDSC